MDFVTIFSNDNKEINLLKLQALSFQHVDDELVNNIYIIHNDTGRFNFKDFINTYYPKSLKDKVKGLDVLKNKNYKVCWQDQQSHRFLAANLVKTEHYLVLEAKNHFLKKVVYGDYFDEKNKPKLFTCNPGNMIKYYYGCLNYYGIECPFNYQEETSNKLLASTPYLLSKKDTMEMTEYIAKREKEPFYNFFINTKEEITEFYLYSTYLIKTNKLKNYRLSPRNYRCIFDWNTIEYNCSVAVNHPYIKIFGIDKKAFETITEESRDKMLEFYSNFYSEEICSFIKNVLLVVT